MNDQNGYCRTLKQQYAKTAIQKYASCILTRYDNGVSNQQKARTGVLLKKVRKEDKNE